MSDIRATGSESRSFPFGILLLALAGVSIALVALLAAPERLRGGEAGQLVAHREQLAVAGFAVLLGLGIGVSIPLLLQ